MKVGKKMSEFFLRLKSCENIVRIRCAREKSVFGDIFAPDVFGDLRFFDVPENTSVTPHFCGERRLFWIGCELQLPAPECFAVNIPDAGERAE
jgi:hypothetical protein